MAEALYLPPAEVAELLSSGDLDIGLIPSIEYQRIRGLRVIPELCVAATTEVRSVLLVCDRPLGEVDKVALDLNSRTSVALVRILMNDRFGISPSFVSMRPDLDSMLGEAQAALIIGDPALAVDRSRHQVYDLAAEWRELTGRPFVFAVWAVRSGLSTKVPVKSLFEESLRLGTEQMDQIVDAAVTEMDLSRSEVEEYLTRNLSFHLGDPELQGLEEFFRRAHRVDLLEEVRPVEFLN